MPIYRTTFPVPPKLCAAGGPYELERCRFFGADYPLFRHRPRTLNATLAQAFDRNRSHSGSRMTESEGETLSFGDFEARAAALADSLVALGIEPGNHVALAMANRAEWMIGFVAVLAIGGVPVLINSRGSGEEMHRAIAMTDCKALICDDERLAVITAHSVPKWRTIALETAGSPQAVDMSFSAAVAGPADATLRFVECDAEAAALIMFSSGTTGFPKAILHSQGGMAHALSLGLLLNESLDALYEHEFGALPAELRMSNSANVQSSPLFHLTGLLPYLRALVCGRPTVLLARWNPDALFDVLEQETVSRLGLVPTMIFDMLQSPRAEGEALGRLRFLANGSAALDPTVARRLQQQLPRCLVFNTYGQTEVMERATCFGGREYNAHPDGSGRIVPSYELRIVGDDGNDVGPGKTGQILVRAPCTMMGYYGDPVATEETLRDGWLATGDIAKIDANGIVFLVDRKKSMVISGGENIYCAEVERVLVEHPAVVEAIAFGEADARLGERLVAVLVLRSGTHADEVAIKAYARDRLAAYKVPRDVHFTSDPLPRTVTGKVARGNFLAAFRKRD
jgi:acyl-CoA synthetase (AMP-forming)/AMP-acid ligase II